MEYIFIDILPLEEEYGPLDEITTIDDSIAVTASMGVWDILLEDLKKKCQP